MSKTPTLKELTQGGTLSYPVILTIKKRLNDGKFNVQDVFDFNNLHRDFILTPEHTEKGIAWLKDKWKTPRGIERKNNPFGYREEEILENFSHFTLSDFYDTASYAAVQMGIHHYVPVWTVHAKDGSTFQYYGFGDEISIIG
jgi:hypothetical protein